MMKLHEIISLLEAKFPPKTAYEWDNVGLLVGKTSQEVNKVLVALDATNNVIDEAIEKQVDLIIVHHPLIFGKINKINNETNLGKQLFRLIENNISVYCMHTNYDVGNDGLNDALLLKLGIETITNLEEEVEVSLGRIGHLESPISFQDLCTLVKGRFGVNNLRIVGSLDKTIKTIAVVTGSGISMFNQVKKQKADAFITGDLKYHEAQDILLSKIATIDLGHYESEIIFKEHLAKQLAQISDLEVVIANEQNPFTLV